jgi:hypothetical protein
MRTNEPASITRRDVGDDLAANRLPNLNTLRVHFSPDLASLRAVPMHLTPLSVYESLNHSYIGETA